MSDMIERVARAIRPEAFEPITEGARTAGMTEFLEKCRERGIEQALRRARAAIEAMREPTVMMILGALEEADDVIKECGGKHDKDQFIHLTERYYRAMINAALKGEAE